MSSAKLCDLLAKTVFSFQWAKNSFFSYTTRVAIPEIKPSIISETWMDSEIKEITYYGCTPRVASLGPALGFTKFSKFAWLNITSGEQLEVGAGHLSCAKISVDHTGVYLKKDTENFLPHKKNHEGDLLVILKVFGIEKF